MSRRKRRRVWHGTRLSKGPGCEGNEDASLRQQLLLGRPSERDAARESRRLLFLYSIARRVSIVSLVVASALRLWQGPRKAAIAAGVAGMPWPSFASASTEAVDRLHEVNPC